MRSVAVWKASSFSTARPRIPCCWSFSPNTVPARLSCHNQLAALGRLFLGPPSWHKDLWPINLMLRPSLTSLTGYSTSTTRSIRTQLICSRRSMCVWRAMSRTSWSCRVTKRARFRSSFIWNMAPRWKVWWNAMKSIRTTF